MLKATTAASVSLDSLSQRMSAGNFLVFAVFQLFHFLHVFLLGHTLTGSKFLLLFSIKSKEEILCFAAKVPNGRTPHVCQAIFLCFCALFSGALAPFLSSKNRRTFRCGGSFSRKSRFLIYLSAVRPAPLPSPSKSYPLHLQYRHLPMSFPHCGR